MEDYNINFQEIIDNFSLEELATFKMRLDKELDKRIDAKEKQIELDKMSIVAIKHELNEAWNYGNV
jgi:hypothetical protein|tara:strand:+ start:106 stop:303 length:198 start_codon:yes stop_codon:yes gene_type:complete